MLGNIPVCYKCENTDYVLNSFENFTNHNSMLNLWVYAKVQTTNNKMHCLSKNTYRPTSSSKLC